eukprot:7018718-Pyramimonas_sp.AAC.1
MVTAPIRLRGLVRVVPDFCHRFCPKVGSAACACWGGAGLAFLHARADALELTLRGLLDHVEQRVQQRIGRARLRMR